MAHAPTLHGMGSDVFWAELSPCEHLVQFYEADDVFMDTLEGFVAGALRSGDSAIVIATAPHRETLIARLQASGCDVNFAQAQDQLILLDAAETLDLFMQGGWPDDEKFAALVRQLLTRAKKHGRKVRAFGEMVAIMWASGAQGATVRLEYLWHQLCSSEGFALLCAYPKVGFTQDAAESINEICAAHSRVLPH